MSNEHCLLPSSVNMWSHLHSVYSHMTNNKTASRRLSHISMMPERKFLYLKEITNLLTANMLHICMSFMLYYLAIKTMITRCQTYFATWARWDSIDECDANEGWC